MSSLITFSSPLAENKSTHTYISFPGIFLSLTSVNVCPCLKSFSLVFIKILHRVRTHLAQVPFSLDVFFCSVSLSFSFSLCWLLLYEKVGVGDFILFFVSLPYALCQYVCVCVCLSCARACTYIRMRDITQFFLFRKIFICSVLISFLLI